MRLKSLEIQGYKSFANKSRVAFADGITAIIGPNGSGKSNVIDAIRWVLGEQSYSNLRGRKTEDMIFAGSDGRARLSMAVVTLLLDNSTNWLPLDFAEVTLSRRAYRSGENEYYLNGSRVRLKDITDILSKAGLGRQTYTVIGQGTIDRVLALQANDRRKLFEEAAGITYHRTKRTETLKRLTETQENLIRINDLIQEIEPQVKRLERQAKRAAKYLELSERLDSQLRLWYGYRWHDARRQRDLAAQVLDERETAVLTEQIKLDELEVTLADQREQQKGWRQRIGVAASASRKLQQEVENANRILAVGEERARQFEAQQGEVEADLRLLTQNLAEQQRQIHDDQTLLYLTTEELKQANLALREQESALNRHQHTRQRLLDEQRRAEQRLQALGRDQAKHESQLGQFDERRTQLATDQTNSDAEVAKLRERQKLLELNQAALRDELAKAAESVGQLEQSRDQARQSLTDVQQKAETLKNELATLRRKEDGLKTRQEMLGRLREQMEGYHDGVRVILNPKIGLSGIIGPISQVINVPSELEEAIAVALGGRMQDVVVESFNEAQQAIEYLKRKRLGRATLLPLDTIRVPSAAQPPRIAGVVGLASELVKTERHLQAVADYALNRTVVVESLAAGRRVFEAMHGGFNLVTIEGELLRSSGSVTGGQGKTRKGAQGTFFAREREWRELPNQLNKVAQEGQTFVDQLKANEQAHKKLEQEIQRLTDSRRQVNNQRRENQTKLDKLTRSLQQLFDNIDWQKNLHHKADTELARLDEREVSTRQKIAALAEQQQQLEAELIALKTKVEATSAETLIEAVNQARTEVAKVQARQEQQKMVLTNHRSVKDQLEHQIEGKQRRLEGLTDEKDRLVQQQTQAEQQVGQLGGQLAQYTDQIETAEAELATLDLELAAQTKQTQALRQALQKLEATYRDSSVALARRESELVSLQQRIAEDLELTPTEERDLPTLIGATLPRVETLPDGVEETVSYLKNKLRRLGNINPDAPREFEAAQERHSFLATQMADLEQAATNLREIIGKLDVLMKDSFAEIFQKTSGEFQRYFKALFGGGEAKILLTDPDNLTETGVEIVARPPGKRLQSMNLLSGGERSLTAQALIFALLSISPTPFVIFDEVDAMLDEANVGRFRDALLGMSQEIQFIIVTHNRRTIEIANTIYGVSMGGDSVSQVLSLQLEDVLETHLGEG